MVDVRRELDLINKQFRRHFKTAGDTVVWYEFVPLGASASASSIYDDVYDEGAYGAGGRSYKPGVVLPVLLGSENEDQRRAIPEGRQPVQTMNLFISMLDMKEAGIASPYEYRQHLNDMYLYDGRYYSVFDYKVRGRLRDEVFVLIQGQEIYIDQEMINDPGPSPLNVASLPWPTGLPNLS
jgi:hypothetical protein